VADQARVRYLNAEDVGEADRDLLRRPINLFRALAHNPDGLRAFHGVGEWIRYGGQLDPRLRELAILRVGYVTSCAYEFSHHVRVGREFGLTDADIELARRPAGVDPGVEGTVVEGTVVEGTVVEGTVDAGTVDAGAADAAAAVVLQAATEITEDLGLADATWQRLAGLLGDAGAVELVLVVAHYCAVVRVLNSLKVDVEPEYEGYLREFPLDGPA
jgi:AhpD family alkylhydroperoxidase